MAVEPRSQLHQNNALGNSAGLRPAGEASSNQVGTGWRHAVRRFRPTTAGSQCPRTSERSVGKRRTLDRTRTAVHVQSEGALTAREAVGVAFEAIARGEQPPGALVECKHLQRV